MNSAFPKLFARNGIKLLLLWFPFGLHYLLLTIAILSGAAQLDEQSASSLVDVERWWLIAIWSVTVPSLSTLLLLAFCVTERSKWICVISSNGVLLLGTLGLRHMT